MLRLIHNFDIFILWLVDAYLDEEGQSAWRDNSGTIWELYWGMSGGLDVKRQVHFTLTDNLWWSSTISLGCSFPCVWWWRQWINRLLRVHRGTQCHTEWSFDWYFFVRFSLGWTLQRTSSNGFLPYLIGMKEGLQMLLKSRRWSKVFLL